MTTGDDRSAPLPARLVGNSVETGPVAGRATRGGDATGAYLLVVTDRGVDHSGATATVTRPLVVTRKPMRRLGVARCRRVLEARTTSGPRETQRSAAVPQRYNAVRATLAYEH